MENDQQSGRLVETAGRGGALHEAIALHQPSSIALIEDNRQVTYAELVDLVRRSAAGLVERGIRPGALVAVAARTEVDGVVAYLAVHAAGAVAAMLNPRAPAPEQDGRLRVLNPELVVLGGDEVALSDAWTAVRPASSPLVDLPRLDGAGFEVFGGRHQDPATILLTSGVAGPPRPAILTHGNLAAVQRGLIAQPGAGLGPGTVALAALPLAHVLGLNSVVSTLLRAGATAVLLDRFDPEQALHLMAIHRVTAVAAVPQMWTTWAKLEGARSDSMASVRRATSSAAHLSVDVAEVIRDRFGVRVAAGYGLTETAGTIVCDDLNDPSPPSVGCPLGDTMVRLVDSDGTIAETGDRGEVWVRGASVFAGFLGAGSGHRSMLAPGGWCRTGDIGVLDEQGALSIVDRLKDVVNVGGFNVSPTEVEDVLNRHPDVEQAVVLGEADARAGERVVAYVVSRPGTTPDPAVLVEHCRTHLARYKVPVRLEVRAELPMTEGGKLLRRLLR